MIRRLLCACVGAVFVGVLALPARAGAKPPDLPEDCSFTLNHGYSSPAHLFRFPWPTDATDSSWNPLQPADKDDVLKDVPRDCQGQHVGWSHYEFRGTDEWWGWLISHWAARQQAPTSEQNDGYLRSIATGSGFASQVLYETMASENETHRYLRSFNNETHRYLRSIDTGSDLAYQAVSDATVAEVETSERSVEVLPMPKEEPEVTCPYLLQQRIDRPACQLADPEIGRDVLDNLKLLQEADELLELAKNLADDGYIDAAMECCDQAAELCPGSPCAARAAATILELTLGQSSDETKSEEASEPKQDDAAQKVSEPGKQTMLSGLMKACHLLMDQGLQHQAAELARQAYALDPQRVMADPLVYKMHLLAESPTARPTGASEESEPQTCPYCPSAGKPIHEIVPQKKKRHPKDATLMKPTLIENLPFEIAANAEGELRVNAECALGGNVYHLRYTHGSLAIWTTADDSQTKP